MPHTWAQVCTKKRKCERASEHCNINDKYLDLHRCVPFWPRPALLLLPAPSRKCAWAFVMALRPVDPQSPPQEPHHVQLHVLLLDTHLLHHLPDIEQLLLLPKLPAPIVSQSHDQLDTHVLL